MKKISDGIYSYKNKEILILGASVKENQHTKTPMTRSSSDGDKYASWGDNNTYPQEFVNKLNKTGAAIGGLDVLVSAHYGMGFRLYQDFETETGVEARERIVSAFPEINEFFKRVRWDIFLSEVVTDFETFRIAFVEYLLSPNYDKIISVKRYKSADCRLGVPDEKSGVVKFVYINTDWEEAKEEFTQKVPFIAADMPLEMMKLYCREKRIDKFIVPVIDTLSTEKIYPKVKWHSSFRNGWVDVVLSVPSFKKYMFENQLNVKHIVYIADDYFAHIYREKWQEISAEEKEQIRKKLVDKIDETMSGNQSAGRSLIAPFFRDQNGNLIKGIEVIPIDDKIKDGNFLPDASAGNSEILFPMGVDPCLLGAGIPGGKGLNGSGSDKREAYTILSTRMPVRRIHTLEIFDRIRDWNGWDESLYGRFPNINLTTLDKNPNGQQTIVT
ncbi:hypothetical protein CAPN008_11820 [Capnocytophaga canis]|uniref:hypothetical protein n=1 Tax=Capnocytophaga canis TaxID=1848903 RepID=UPI001AD3DFA3|nr:hypothetical protein [Capnocytophaga canis]GIM61132.1 hypothetical protein CAPN008_11820 [Capnocytophaga canis]